MPCPLCYLRCMDKTLQIHDRGGGPAPYYHHAPFGPGAPWSQPRTGWSASLLLHWTRCCQTTPDWTVSYCPSSSNASSEVERGGWSAGTYLVTDCCHALVCRWPQHALSSNLRYIPCEMTNQGFAAWPFFCLSTYHLDGKKGKDTYLDTGRWMDGAILAISRLAVPGRSVTSEQPAAIVASHI